MLDDQTTLLTMLFITTFFVTVAVLKLLDVKHSPSIIIVTDLCKKDYKY